MGGRCTYLIDIAVSARANLLDEFVLILRIATRYIRTQKTCIMMGHVPLLVGVRECGRMAQGIIVVVVAVVVVDVFSMNQLCILMEFYNRSNSSNNNILHRRHHNNCYWMSPTYDIKYYLIAPSFVTIFPFCS